MFARRNPSRLGSCASAPLWLALPVALLFARAVIAGENEPYTGAACAAPVEAWFTAEVWEKVGAVKCLQCHKAGGDAEDSHFVLRDSGRAKAEERAEFLRHNRNAFARMAREKSGENTLLLAKVVGGLKHGGKEVLPADSTGYRVLEEFVRRVNAPPAAKPPSDSVADTSTPPFFDGVAMIEDRRLLRRVTLSLAGRLPTAAEESAVAKDGQKAFLGILDGLMQEDAFFERLREGFNDIFLTLGVDGNVDQTALSYEHFEKTRHWYQNYDLSHIKNEKERTMAGYKLADEYRKALLGEPMRLIEYIVRNNRPFTEIVTADYIMVSPYSARGYGVYDEVKGKFKNADDHFEYVPVKLKALVGRSKEGNQESATGFYPHAGLLSTFQYLARYPTTETNRNRLRARMYYQQFLGVDVLELAARVTDAAAVTAKYKVPTMEAAECVVCHKTVDPVAGLFQDYWRFADAGIYGRRKEGWFTDMFVAGFEGEDLPAAERWRSLQWLGERTAKDPRFATAMVEHAYYILKGRKVLLPPKDLEDSLYSAKQRAYRAQRREIEGIAARFAQANFNFKNMLKDWVQSDFYRADGLATAEMDPKRRAELDDLGLVRLLSPEQVERKIGAVFGKRWNKLDEQSAMLYGGIDSKEVTERAADPSGAMGAIQRTLANDVACKNTALDFSKKPEERQLFPHIELDVLPGASPEADAKIRNAIVHLHERVLGRYEKPDSPAVERSYKLFAGLVADAAERKNVEKRETYECRRYLPEEIPDAHYTLRAWRAVLTYLLRQEEFLYE